MSVKYGFDVRFNKSMCITSFNKVSWLTSFEGNPSIVGFIFILELTASSFIERNYKIHVAQNKIHKQEEKIIKWQYSIKIEDKDIHLNLPLQ